MSPLRSKAVQSSPLWPELIRINVVQIAGN
jgi:hypothetical protein